MYSYKLNACTFVTCSLNMIDTQKSFYKHFVELKLKANFSCICLTIKMASLVSLPFINPNHISSISICCRILFLKILSTTFITCSNNFIPLYDPHSIGSLSLCKLVILCLTSSPLEYNFLSQFHYINPVSTEFQYPLWIVSFPLLDLTCLGICLFICFDAAATSSILIQSAGPSLTLASIL